MIVSVFIVTKGLDMNKRVLGFMYSIVFFSAAALYGMEETTHSGLPLIQIDFAENKILANGTSEDFSAIELVQDKQPGSFFIIIGKKDGSISIWYSNEKAAKKCLILKQLLPLNVYAVKIRFEKDTSVLRIKGNNNIKYMDSNFSMLN